MKTVSRPLRYTAADGTELHSRLYLPAETEHTALPAVLVLPE